MVIDEIAVKARDAALSGQKIAMFHYQILVNAEKLKDLDPVAFCNNLEDYLIPVIKSMLEGHDYRKVFNAVANKLDVRYNTVSAQCTRALGLTTECFVSMVKERKIIDLLKEKYPNQVALIKRELVKP